MAGAEEPGRRARAARGRVMIVSVLAGCGMAWACGSDGSSGPAAAPAGTAGASGSAGAPSSDAGDPPDVSLSDAGIDWPDADTRPDGSVEAGPSPTFDSGAPEAGPAPGPFTCQDRPPATAGVNTLTVRSGNREREVRLYVPESYRRGEGSMLVLNFHGFSSANWQQEILTGMNGAVDGGDVLVAYPAGIASSWNAGDCCGTAWFDAVDDVGFVRDLLDVLERDYCIDPRRIHATGMSNGGFLSHRLGCELSDRVASIAPVAGVLGVPPAECVPARPVPVLQIHGTSDPLVPYEGGTPILNNLGAGLVFRSVAETMAFWAAHNGCSDETQVFFEHGDTMCTEWLGCAARTALCRVEGGGHTWPAGLPIPLVGKTTNDLDATRTMLDFFMVNPLPP